MQALPIDPLIPTALAALGLGSREDGGERGGKKGDGKPRALVVTAPPGSGKSTRLPPALANALDGPVLLLQPRRIAARSLAARIASERNWVLGREVGYRVRFEKNGSDRTKLWVMTEGTLTRQLANDPYLDKGAKPVAAVILDEFHERSLHTDLALACLRELQQSIRDDLRIVVMSATMDPAPVAAFLGNCPILSGEGRAHPVTTSHWQGRQDITIEEQAAAAARAALTDPEGGDILVFLPGVGEIRNCARILADGPASVLAVITPLHGGSSPEEQEAALGPAPAGKRKIVLATNVAETALTIPGVRTVIDSGLARIMHHDPATGVDELRLEPIARQSADQRSGRAGRTAPGTCVRLWTPLADNRMRATAIPEVRRADLTPAILLLKRWGCLDATAFPWFERPEDLRLSSAEDLLVGLGAIPAVHTALSPEGERLAGLPLHPRLGRLLVAAAAAHALPLGAALAALASERDIRLKRLTGAAPDPGPADALERLESLVHAEAGKFQPFLRNAGVDPAAARQVCQARDELLQAWRGANIGWTAGKAATVSRSSGKDAATRKDADDDDADPDLVCRLLLTAFPDRVVRRSHHDPNQGTMVGGVAVELDKASMLWMPANAPADSYTPLFVAVEIQLIERGGRPVAIVRQASACSEDLLSATIPNAIVKETAVTYDEDRGRVALATRWRYHDLVLRSAGGQPPDAAAAAEALAAALAPDAEKIVRSDEEAAAWLTRVAWLRAVRPQLYLPEFAEADFRDIVATCCAGCTAKAEVLAKPKLVWLASRLTRAQGAAVDAEAPSHLDVPSGSSIRLDYSAANAESPPVLAVRLQELFGLAETPRLAGGAVPVLLHLLGPNYRVEQVTRDLGSFWANTYPQVRKDLRGRYPKHSWPDDPLVAEAVAKGRPRS